jgi:hypothetical protein
MEEDEFEEKEEKLKRRKKENYDPAGIERSYITEEFS